MGAEPEGGWRRWEDAACCLGNGGMSVKDEECEGVEYFTYPSYQRMRNGCKVLQGKST